jgi:hypothetical protein
MTSSTDTYRALCSDFYVNQKLAVKLDLPRERQTILDLCDRLRRQFPAMSLVRRYRDELALETPAAEEENRWVAVKNNTIRSGVVNPARFGDAYELHRCVLELVPYFLSVSPLDVDYVELLYGFDLAAPANHDGIVFDALLSDSPLARLLDIPGAEASDCQPLLGVVIRDAGGGVGPIEVGFEVKTASRGTEASGPISVYLTLRRFGAVADAKELPHLMDALARRGEELAASHVVPNIIGPIREAMGTSSL